MRVQVLLGAPNESEGKLTEEIVVEGEAVEEVEAGSEVSAVSESYVETPSADEVPFFVEDDTETDGLILAQRSKEDGTKHF